MALSENQQIGIVGVALLGLLFGATCWLNYSTPSYVERNAIVNSAILKSKGTATLVVPNWRLSGNVIPSGITVTPTGEDSSVLTGSPETLADFHGVIYRIK